MAELVVVGSRWCGPRPSDQAWGAVRVSELELLRLLRQRESCDPGRRSEGAGGASGGPRRWQDAGWRSGGEGRGRHSWLQDKTRHDMEDRPNCLVAAAAGASARRQGGKLISMFVLASPSCRTRPGWARRREDDGGDTVAWCSTWRRTLRLCRVRRGNDRRWACSAHKCARGLLWLALAGPGWPWDCPALPSPTPLGLLPWDAIQCPGMPWDALETPAIPWPHSPTQPIAPPLAAAKPWRRPI